MKSVITTLSIGGALLCGCTAQPYANDASNVGTLLIFHNNSGPMCLAALDWLDGVTSEHPALVIEEHLTYEAGEIELLAELETQFRTSQGVSTSFEYLPIIFFQEHAFSGFNDGIAETLLGLMSHAGSVSRRSSSTGTNWTEAATIRFVVRLIRHTKTAAYVSRADTCPTNEERK